MLLIEQKKIFCKMMCKAQKATVRNSGEKIKMVLPNKCKHSSINLINKETNLPIDRNATADFINKYFANVGPKLAQKFSA